MKRFLLLCCSCAPSNPNCLNCGLNMNEAFLGGSTAQSSALQTETKESILDEELEKLNDMKFQLKDENAAYLKNHQEFNELLDDFVGEVFKVKPKDIIGFGAKYFSKRVSQSEALAEIKIKSKDKVEPLVICSPSGAGKNELIKILLESYPNFFSYSVSHTTRKPRDHEIDGESYVFCTKEEMKMDIDNGRYFEHAFIRGAYYGTTYSSIENSQCVDKICILAVDSQGVQNIKSSDLHCKYLFVAPPTIEKLEESLRSRVYETEESVDKKLSLARSEIAYGMEKGNFDGVVVFETLDSCFDDAINMIAEWYPQFNFEGESEEDAGKK